MFSPFILLQNQYSPLHISDWCMASRAGDTQGATPSMASGMPSIPFAQQTCVCSLGFWSSSRTLMSYQRTMFMVILVCVSRSKQFFLISLGSHSGNPCPLERARWLATYNLVRSALATSLGCSSSNNLWHLFSVYTHSCFPHRHAPGVQVEVSLSPIIFGGFRTKASLRRTWSKQAATNRHQLG